MSDEIKKLESTIRKHIKTSHVFTNDMIKKTVNETQADINQIMQAMLGVAASRSQTPISGFNVGAAVLCTRQDLEYGHIYPGANLEFSNLPLAFTIHAEQSAISNAWHHHETHISKLSVSYTPCGFCRQFILEFDCLKQSEILICSEEGGCRPYSTSELIPDSFGPEDLNIRESVLNTSRQNFDPETARNFKKKTEKEACYASNLSYAPYSKNYAGVCIKTSDNVCTQGRYIENAAYNPSITPFISALNIMNIGNRLTSYQDIKEVILVEKKGLISQRSVTEFICTALGITHMTYLPILQDQHV